MTQGDIAITDDKDKTNLFGTTFREVSSSNSCSRQFRERKKYFEENTFNSIVHRDEPFIIGELERALSKKKNTSSGQDSISYTMIKHLGGQIVDRREGNELWAAGGGSSHSIT